MHRGNGCVPRGSRLPQPGEEPIGLKARSAPYPSTGCERRQKSGYQPMNMEERHDAQTTIVRPQARPAHDALGRVHHRRVEDGDEFGACGCSGSVQVKGDIAGLRRAVGTRCGQRRRLREGPAPGSGAGDRSEHRHTAVPRGRKGSLRGAVAGDQHARTRVPQNKGDLRRDQRRVQGSAPAGVRDAEEQSSCARSRWRYDGHARITPQSLLAQEPICVSKLVLEIPVGARDRSRTQNGRFVSRRWQQCLQNHTVRGRPGAPALVSTGAFLRA